MNIDMQLVRPAVLGFVTCVLLAACNLFTGADGIEVVGGGPGSGASGPQYAPADGVAIQSIAVYQSIERPLMSGGAMASSSVPLVANREALVRVFYSVDEAYGHEPLLGRLQLGEQKPIDVAGALGAGSTPAELGSTLNFRIPAEALVAPLDYRVEILQAVATSSGTNTAATYPAKGQEALPLTTAGPQLKLVLVPIRYGADGSNRLPDTSEGQLEGYRQAFLEIYPIPAVTITVLDPQPWNMPVKANFSGWQELLNSMIEFRQKQSPPPDDYYYGIFSPTETFQSYCGGACVTGLSALAGPGDAWARVGVGIGFSGVESTSTAAHEVGHQHGLGHAPCGTTSGNDPAFPDSGGKTGVWGWKLFEDQLRPPTDADFMSYCKPEWVSTYHYQKLFDRLKLVNGADIYTAASAPLAYERITIGPDGSVSWLAPLALPLPPTGEPVALTLETDAGPLGVTGSLHRYSHLDGGIVLFSRGESVARGVSVRIDGRPYRAER